MPTDRPSEPETLAALEKRERAMATLLENLPGMAYRCRNESSWTMLYLSQGCRDLTGRAPEELLGNECCSYGDIIVPEDRDFVWRSVQQAVDEGRPYTMEYRIVDADDAVRWVWERGRQVEADADGTAILEGFISDITARKHAEIELQDLNATLESRVSARTAELRHANEQLLEHDRLKSMFLASMSHELRTPLNSIIGFTGVILQGLAGETSNEQRTQLEMVQKSADHLLALINEVLDISQIESDNLELAPAEFDLTSVVDEVAQSSRPAAEAKGLSVTIDAPTPVTITSDALRIKQVLTNLVGNAVKFTDQGEIVLQAHSDGTETSVTVRDTGPGISVEDMGLLFQPFSRLSSTHAQEAEGTGLGLYLSDRVATALGGRIDVRSKVGEGSAFTLVLPAVPLLDPPDRVQ